MNIEMVNFNFFLQSGTATGTCGTISWQIEHLDTRLIVMWSVPFNFNIHDSYFAVGMIFNRGRFTSSSYWFNQMYYSEKGANFLGIFVWENNVFCCYCIMSKWDKIMKFMNACIYEWMKVWMYLSDCVSKYCIWCAA